MIKILQKRKIKINLQKKIFMKKILQKRKINI